MKTKPFLKDKTKVITASAIIILIVLGALGFYLSQRGGKELNKPQTNTKEQQVQKNVTSKVPAQNQTPSTNTTTPTTNAVNATTKLTDVSIQAIINTSDQTVSLSLYGPQGTYDVDKCSNYQNSQCISGWIKVLVSQSYPGYGGLSLDQLTSNGSKETYIAYGDISGKRVSASTAIVVDPSLVTSTKTFTESQ